MFPSYRNQSIDFDCKSIDLFLYEKNLFAPRLLIYFLEKKVLNPIFSFYVYYLKRRVSAGLLFLLILEAYLEPSRTSMMKLFCKNIERLLNINYFLKKAPSQVFEWVLNTSLRFKTFIFQASTII